MAYELVKFEDDGGQAVQITPQDVRDTFCPSATPQEVQLFLALCATQHLNPYVKDAYLIKYGNGPASIITSRAAIQKRADSNPDYEGTELGVVVLNAQGAIEHRAGEAHYKALGEQLLGGWARVYRKGRKPYYAEVPMSEYSTGKSGWAKMPGTMIAKVAEMHALRAAFPRELQGMYSQEEMAQAEQQPAQPAKATVEPAPRQESRPADATELEALRGWTERLSGLGYAETEVKAYLWARYKEGGLGVAREAYEGMLGAVGASRQEEAPVEPDLEAEDIEF